MVYRFWVLGGIGGYLDPSGTPTILHFSPLRLLELLLFRMWSVLLLPINWSVPSEWWLTLGMLVFLIGSSVATLMAHPVRRKVWSAISFCLVAILPASHLALLDSRLTGSRVYHLALIGLALLVAAIYDGFSRETFARLAVGGLILFQTAALTHNLLIWADTARLAGTVCRNFPSSIIEGGTVIVTDLPSTRNGVFFLKNGFSDCVFVNSGKRVSVVSSVPVESKPVEMFRWDEGSQSVMPVH